MSAVREPNPFRRPFMLAKSLAGRILWRYPAVNPRGGRSKLREAKLSSKILTPIRPAVALCVNFALLLIFMTLCGRRFPEQKYYIDMLLILIHQGAICLVLYIEHRLNVYHAAHTKELDKIYSILKNIGKDVAIHNNVLQLPTLYNYNYSSELVASGRDTHNKKNPLIKKLFPWDPKSLMENSVIQATSFTILNVLAIFAAISASNALGSFL